MDNDMVFRRAQAWQRFTTRQPEKDDGSVHIVCRARAIAALQTRVLDDARSCQDQPDSCSYAAEAGEDEQVLTLVAFLASDASEDVYDSSFLDKHLVSSC